MQYEPRSRNRGPGISEVGAGHRHYLPGLDGLRAVAVLLVVLHHSLADLPPDHLLRPIASNGWFGVPIFFCLSGFLITHLLLDEEETYGAVDLGRFYARRTLRILPPVLLLVVTFSALSWWGWLEASPRCLASCLFFYRNYASGPWATAHLWTLAVEEHFYLLWPIVFVACRSLRGRLSVVAIAVVVAPFWRYFNIKLAGSPEALNWLRTDLRYDAIATGCLWALAARDQTIGRWLRSRVMTRSLTSGLAIIALTVLQAELLTAVPFMKTISPTIEYLCVAVIINQVSRSPQAIPTRLLELSVVAWLGRLSYSIYLWQQLFSPPAWPGWRTPLVHLPWNLPAILAVALVSYYAVERPCQRLRARFRRGSRPGDGTTGHLESPLASPIGEVTPVANSS